MFTRRQFHIRNGITVTVEVKRIAVSNADFLKFRTVKINVVHQFNVLDFRLAVIRYKVFAAQRFQIVCVIYVNRIVFGVFHFRIALYRFYFIRNLARFAMELIVILIVARIGKFNAYRNDCVFSVNCKFRPIGNERYTAIIFVITNGDIKTCKQAVVVFATNDSTVLNGYVAFIGNHDIKFNAVTGNELFKR